MRFIVLIFTLLILLYDEVYSQDNTCAISWDCAQQVSHDQSFSCAPQIISVGDTTHFLWFGDYYGDGNGIQYCHSFDGGRTISQQIQLRSYDSAAGGSGRLAASGANLYLLYLTLVPPPTSYNMAFMRSTTAGTTWEPPVLLGDCSPKGIAAHGADVYIYFNYYGEPYLRGGLLRSHDYGAHWDTVLYLPTVERIQALLVATSGVIHLLMDKVISGGAAEMIYRRSTDGGLTFPAHDTLSVNDGFISDEGTITGDDKGNLFVAWREGKYGSIDGYYASILLRRSTDNGLTWGTEQILTYAPTGLFPEITKKDSTVVVGWNEYVNDYGRPMVRMSFDLAQTWCDTTSVSVGIGSDMFVALDNNILSVSWWESQDEEIHYRRGFLGNSHEAKIAVISRWNIVSLSVDTKDKSKHSLFPNAISDAYAFENGVYSIKDTLKPGVGYWMKFAKPETISLQGTTRYCDIVPVKKGWNLIGGISSPVALSSVNTNPINIIQSRLFSYYNGYRTVDTLMPGSGYWIKVKSDGELIISSCALCGEGLTGIKERSPP